ncbi:MAG: helix-turn-helix domain-containing protein [Gammaproteobacteria bacterium]|nr:helix-turn-helix domain-containing protein [Gammaproteobacteria bacterium]MDH5629199.1 helix-turn-helix domain-containing protein [Gammaproteobacteria bacterium]
MSSLNLNHVDTQAVLVRLKQLYDVSKNKELPDKIGRSESAISLWKSRGIPFDVLVEVSIKENTSLNWLCFGIGDQQLNPYQQPLLEKASFMVAEENESYGENQDESSNPFVDDVLFKESWLDAHHLKSENIRLFKMPDKSMEPNINKDDRVLVNLDKIEAQHGKTYLIKIGAEFMIRMLTVLPNNQFQLSAANNLFPPLIVSHKELQKDVYLLGQVVGHFHLWG